MNGKKKTALLCVLLLAVALLCCGCGQEEQKEERTPLLYDQYTDYDAVLAYYNEVAFTDTLATLTERYGEPAVLEMENGLQYQWIMSDDYGFTCVFFDDGPLRAKAVYYKDIRQFRDLSNAQNLSIVENFDKNVTFQNCVQYFVGRPIETMRLAQEDSPNTIYRIYTWIDANENCVQICFTDQGKISSINYDIR